MELEEIFGSCKQKTNLAPRLKGDSHRHNRVIAKLNVKTEQPGADQIHGNVEVF